jgi:glycosyltransferase involved in cell wall biosynthesis
MMLRLRRLISRHFDFALSNSREGTTYVRQVLRMPADKVAHWTYLVPDRELLSSRPQTRMELPAARPRFLFVGEMVEEKGVRFLLEAVSILSRRITHDFSCVMVGGGPLLESFRQYASSLGISRMVHWTGRVPYLDVGEYFRSCDAFVFPSLGDVWGMVVLEAMLADKPVLCSHCAGASELLRHGENGWIFDPRNPDELARYMEEVIRSPERAAEFGMAVQDTIKNLTPGTSAQGLIYAIEVALGSGRADLQRPGPQ